VDQNSELLSRVGLAKRPVRGSHIVGDHRSSVAGCDLERQDLTIKVRVALPVLSPVPGHGLPTCFRAFNRHSNSITSSTNIGYENKIEVRVAVDCEPDSTTLFASNSAYIYIYRERERERLI
jgi:hypothetical protein